MPVEATIPAVYALHLAAAVRACGGSDQRLLQAVELDPETLSQPSARLGLERFIQLCVLSIELSGEPGLGFVLGTQAPISRFGSLGFAVMAAADLREAIELIVRYMPTISNACHYHLRVEHGRAVLQLDEYVDFGAARETVVFSLTTSLWRLGQWLTGHPLPGDVEFAFAEPPYFARFAADVPGSFKFMAGGNRVRFAAEFLDLPLLTADPAAARSARAQCERELRLLDPAAAFLERVRDALALRDTRATRVLSPAQLARKLGMAERTLKRRLTEQRTSYSQLLEQERKARALELLHTSASVDEVAQRLGYADSANFTRAFRRWTGTTPRAFRDKLRADG